MTIGVKVRAIWLPSQDAAFGARVETLVTALNDGELTKDGVDDLLQAGYPNAEIWSSLWPRSPSGDLWYIYRDGAHADD